MQAGGRRFESDHLHHVCGVEGVGSGIAEKSEGSASMVLLWTAMLLVPPVGGATLGSSPRAGLCQGESGSGASLDVPARKSDRMLMASREQGDRSEAIVVHATGPDPVVLSESDPHARDRVSVVGDWRTVVELTTDHRPLTTEDGFCAW